jgi:hypothetical protein
MSDEKEEEEDKPKRQHRKVNPPLPLTMTVLPTAKGLFHGRETIFDDLTAQAHQPFPGGAANRQSL